MRGVFCQFLALEELKLVVCVPFLSEKLFLAVFVPFYVFDQKIVVSVKSELISKTAIFLGLMIIYGNFL